MSFEDEAVLPFDFSSPLQFYPGEFPVPILQRAAEFLQSGCPEQEAIVRALQKFGKELGSIAANDEKPQEVV